MDAWNPGISEICACEPGQSPLVDATKSAFHDALASMGKLPPEIFDIEGMSGKKYRIFINNLIARIENAAYLEVGAWMGSTFCSAIHNNTVRAFAIDNWVQFDGPTHAFLANVARNCSKNVRINLLTEDFRKVRFNTIGKFNVYMFDGPHEARDQFDGLYLAQPALTDEYVFIVDDWNWDRVRDGTSQCIKHLDLETRYQVEVRTSSDGGHTKFGEKASDWHNGYLICVLKKR
jgi:hypothetical protein